MLRSVLRRLLLSIPVLFLVSVLTFVLTALIPGNPGTALLGTQATKTAVAAIDKSLGLDRPIYVQYWSWLSGLFRGDLGRSVFNGEPVTATLNAGLPVTLTLLIGATLVSAFVGIPLGVLSAQRRGGSRRVVDLVSMLGFAMPSFWLGLLLVYLLSQTLHLLPPSGWTSFSSSPSGWVRSVILPLVALSVAGVSVVARQTRQSMIQALGSEYIKALRARGIKEASIVYKHALRNALPNVVTLIGLYVVSLLLGTTLIESVFALQGLGSIAVQATSQHDLPVLQGVGIYFTIIVIVVFCFVDLARAWLNPKLRTRS
jgi:peptide/nickel transport system permease protein